MNNKNNKQTSIHSFHHESIQQTASSCSSVSGTGVTTQWLRALLALVEDLDSVCKTYTITHYRLKTPVPVDTTSSSGLHRQPGMNMVHIYTHKIS